MPGPSSYVSDRIHNDEGKEVIHSNIKLHMCACMCACMHACVCVCSDVTCSTPYTIFVQLSLAGSCHVTSKHLSWDPGSSFQLFQV